MFPDLAAVLDWVATGYDDAAIDALLDAVRVAEPPETGHKFVLAKLRQTPPPFHIWERQQIEGLEVTVIAFATTRQYVDEKAGIPTEPERCYGGQE